MILQSELIGDGMWALILGPAGLLVASVIVVVILWRKLNSERTEHAEEMKSLHENRHNDLVEGLKYREEVSLKLLEDKADERVIANKLTDAVQSLANQQEKMHETVKVVNQDIRDIKTIINNNKNGA